MTQKKPDSSNLQDTKKQYAWNLIHEFDGREKLTIAEKKNLCDNISSATRKPPLIITIAAKIIPFPVTALLLLGCVLTETTVYGLVILSAAILYLIFALLLYMFQQVWVYDRWKKTEKEIMKKDVYKVPIEVGLAWQSDNRPQNCYINIRYTEEENFCDIYRIPEKIYQNIEHVRLFCYYYEGKREKYCGKYKIFYIDEGHRKEQNPPS